MADEPPRKLAKASVSVLLALGFFFLGMGALIGKVFVLYQKYIKYLSLFLSLVFNKALFTKVSSKKEFLLGKFNF